MATPRAVRHGYADLPAELLQHIFAQAGDDWRCAMSVQDRLRAEATCRAWRQALWGLPFHTLRLGSASYSDKKWEAKKRWIVATQPASTAVVFLGLGPGETLRPLHSLDPEPLEDLHIWSGDLATVLPRPQLFPNLRTLRSDAYLHWHPAWFRQLGQLRRLERLELRGMSIDGGRQCTVCALPALTSLRLDLRAGSPSPRGTASLCVDLSTLPSLLELQLSIDTPLELRTVSPIATGSTGPFCSLRRLEISSGSSAVVDLGALPALTYLHFVHLAELTGAATIASATSLRCLALGDRLWRGAGDHFQLVQPWVLELLRRAPPSLRSLQLCAGWLAAVAEPVSGLTQLRALSIKGPKGASAAQPLGDGPVWDRLRALHWDCTEPLPEAVCLASRLELLHYCSPALPTPRDLHLLASLPALRRLRVAGPWTNSPGGVVDEVADIAEKLVPCSATVELEYLCGETFAEASAGFALLD